MTSRTSIKTPAVFLIIAVLGFGTYAYAGWGKGGGYGRGCDYGGPGYHRGMAWYEDNIGKLSDSQIEALKKERVAFHESTKDLRQNMYQKELELASELAKESPDIKKAAALQKDLSGFEADMDQKRITHIIEMKKIAPDAGRHFSAGGYGRMGDRYRGKGNCWR